MVVYNGGMKRRIRYKKLTKRGIMVGGLAGILTVILIGAMGVAQEEASALTYQSSVGVNFTFNPTITINVGGDLVINNLTPGSSSDSNIISVGVTTNAAYGYNLSATVGQKGGTSALVNGSDSTKTFTNLATTAGTAATLANFSDNTWGYAYSTDNGTNWVSGSVGSTASGYAGLPLDTNDDASMRGYGGVTLISTENPADNQSVKFKIGAKASAGQVSGTYTNTINFYAVSQPVPMTLENAYAAAGKTRYNGYYKLQDMNSDICDATEILDDGSQMQAIDTRDNKIYWITKLQDGHCWMTQNLDLDLGTATLTHDSTTLYHDDTDLGWGTDTATQSWTPDNATQTVTYDSNMKGTFTTLGTGSTYYNIPKSLDVGDWYYAGYDGTTLLTSTTVNYLTSDNRVKDGDTVTVNDGNGVDYFSTAPFSTNGTHGHVGNYYNWSASVASNDTSGYASSTYADISGNPQNSICPAGWRLPTITSASPSYSSAGSKNEFARLVYLYNGNSYVTNSSAKLELAPLFFARGGYVYGASLYDSGYCAGYWSSSVYSSSNAYSLRFYATVVAPQYYYDRGYGRSVRCLAR